MANVQHSAQTDPDIHEPKGASTANSGETYIADGLGSGSWKAPGGTIYGEMQIIDNSTAVAVTDATDATFNTASDFVKLNSSLWQTGLVNGVTFNSSGYLLVVTSGIYELAFWATVTHSVNGAYVAFKFSTDDTNATLSPRKVVRKIGTGGDIGSIAANGLVSLSAGDKIALFVAAKATGSGNVTVEDAGFKLILLKET